MLTFCVLALGGGIVLMTLLVEDYAHFRELIRDELLSQFPSMKVMDASNEKEAYERLASYPVDLIFMDIMLKKENGLDLTMKIKADYKDKAVAILSGFDTPEYQAAAVRCGANCFIGKDWTNLAGKISAVAGCFYRAKEGGRMPCCLWLLNKKN